MKILRRKNLYSRLYKGKAAAGCRSPKKNFRFSENPTSSDLGLRQSTAAFADAACCEAFVVRS